VPHLGAEQLVQDLLLMLGQPILQQFKGMQPVSVTKPMLLFHQHKFTQPANPLHCFSQAPTSYCQDYAEELIQVLRGLVTLLGCLALTCRIARHECRSSPCSGNRRSMAAAGAISRGRR
jgi:hypothetical protein